MSPLDPRPMPENNGNRHGRPFTLRIEEEQERELRKHMVQLEQLPYDKRPPQLFGWDAGGGGGRRRQSFGWFVLWAALEWSRHHDGEGGLRLRQASPGKTKRKGAKRAGRKPAKRAGRKARR